jgi:flagellar protein FlaG
MALSTIGNNGAQAAPLPAAPQGASAPAARVPAAAVPEPMPQQQPADQKQLQRAMESMKQLIEAKAPNSLSFSVDDSTGKTVVKVSDAQTGEMIRQIPSEELLEIARSLDKLQGMLLRQEA